MRTASYGGFMRDRPRRAGGSCAAGNKNGRGGGLDLDLDLALGNKDGRSGGDRPAAGGIAHGVNRDLDLDLELDPGPGPVLDLPELEAKRNHTQSNTDSCFLVAAISSRVLLSEHAHHQTTFWGPSFNPTADQAV